MHEFRIPSALALVASLALVGCGDLGTAPSVDELGPQFSVHERPGRENVPIGVCPPGFISVASPGGTDTEVAYDPVDANRNNIICVKGNAKADDVVPPIFTVPS